MLDYAENTLHCDTAYVVFDRTLTDTQRKKIVQNFSFFGFELLSPYSPALPLPLGDRFAFMGYHLESSDDSDDEEELEGGWCSICYLLVNLVNLVYEVNSFYSAVVAIVCQYSIKSYLYNHNTEHNMVVISYCVL